MSTSAKNVNSIEGISEKRRKIESSTKPDVVTDSASDYSDDVKSDASLTKTERIANAFQTILECLGEDVTRPGIEDTPLRAAKALQFLTSGYSQTCADVVGAGVFQEGKEGQMVLVKDIDINSLCEHHMLPFTGKVHIAYIVGPSRTVLGLSKLARIADMHSRKLQVQERLTRQIAADIAASTEALGVAVLMEASHMCMVMRGVQKPGSSTSTTSFVGTYESDAALRSEFLALIK